MKRNLLTSLLVVIFATACQTDNYEVTDENYAIVSQRLEMYENLRPTDFLEADGHYNENFWGDKIKITAKITNSAKLASYNKVTLRVSYYDKNQNLISTDDFTINKKILPQRVTKVNLEITNYSNVESLGWDVVDAMFF